MTDIQLLIIGGGPAGMAAALIAGRARLSAVIVDAGTPRNAASHASHGFVTRDGAPALELQRIAREQLRKYPCVEYVHDLVEDVKPLGGGFVVTGSNGRWHTRRLIFATGYRTNLAIAELPGIEELYGRSIFPCPFCDGFEIADRPIAIFGSDKALHMSRMLRGWSEDLVVFTNGRAISQADLQAIEASGAPVETARVERLEHDDGVLRQVVLEGGRAIDRRAGFLAELHAEPATDLPERLGVGTAVHPFIGIEHLEADDFGKTNVEGIYVVGDLKRIFGGITAAAHDGDTCVAGIVHEIAIHSGSGTDSHAT